MDETHIDEEDKCDNFLQGLIIGIILVVIAIIMMVAFAYCSVYSFYSSPEWLNRGKIINT